MDRIPQQKDGAGTYHGSSISDPFQEQGGREGDEGNEGKEGLEVPCPSLACACVLAACAALLLGLVVRFA